MGIWDYIYSSSDSLKRNTPDLTAVKGWCRSPYGYGLAAVTKIDSVRINATQMLTQYMSDEETRSRLCLLATDWAKNAAFYGFQEGLKSFPGGTFVYMTVSRSIRHEGENWEMKAWQGRVAKLEEIIKKEEMKACELQARVVNLEEIIKKYEGLDR